MERKSKKVIVSMLLFVLLSLLIVSPVYADSQTYVDTANKVIQNAINHALNAADNAIEQYNKQVQIDANNPDQLAIDKKVLDQRLDNIIATLLHITDQVSDNTYRKALRDNITLLQYYENVKIGDQIIQVDPFINV